MKKLIQYLIKKFLLGYHLHRDPIKKKKAVQNEIPV